MDPNTSQPDASAQAPSQTQDQVDDWGSIEADFLADKGIDPEKYSKKEAVPDEPNEDEKPKEDTGEAPAPPDKSDAPNGGEEDPEKKPKTDEEDADPNEDPKLEQQSDEGNPQREYRAIQRQIEQDRAEVKADVQKELYPDWSDDIVDDQGVAMKTPRDVMNHINPNTGKRFTEEEATAWLFAAQKYKDKERSEMQERVEHVTDVMITQRDEADAIKSKYGKLLAQLPDLRKEIWADYRETLVVDKDSGLIIDAPLSLQRFFERALRPYDEYAKELQAKAEQPQTPPAPEKPAITDAERKQAQTDREEITSTGGGSVQDPEEKEWADVSKNYYEGK